MEQKVTKKEIIEQTKRLAQLIAQSEEVEIFKQAEEKIKNNDKVQKLMNQIKFMQKQAVHNEHYEKQQALSKVEEQLEKLHEELDEIPIVNEFKQSQLEINDLLQMITHVISNTVTDEIILSTGGNPLSGKTGEDEDACPIK
jgi:cell fate (sporulation/competence/biofilm development) regulator YmcA (YheA/YmcA/DUF963 family)